MNLNLPLKHIADITNLPKFDLDKFKAIFECHAWSYIKQIIINTRNYEHGLFASYYFIDQLEKYKNSLNPREYDDISKSLYFFLLHMLDKLDRWDEYLQVWQKIRENTTLYHKYSKNSTKYKTGAFKEFILSETDDTVFVHFLYSYCINHRKKIIDRKYKRKLDGKKLGNLYHATQNELSPEQIIERFNWINKIFRVKNT